MRKIEHLGIAVYDLSQANEQFRQLLGTESYKIEEVSSEGVTTSFFMVGDMKIELLESKRAGSPVSKFLEKRGEGLHHIAFEVDDIKSEMVKLKEQGYRLLNENPKTGADNKHICFLHPKDTNGVLVELCQEEK